MRTPTVYLQRGHTRYATVRHVFEQTAAEIDWSQHGQVLVKPNLVSTTKPLADTHPDALRAVLDVIRDITDAPVIVAEGTATQNTWLAYHRLGYVDLVKRYRQVSLLDLNVCEAVPLRAYRRNLTTMSLLAALPVLDASLVISVGPPKTHDFVIVTMSLKNLIMGTLISHFAPQPPTPEEVAHGHAVRSPLARVLKWARQAYDRVPSRLQALSVFEWPRFYFMAHESRSHKFRLHQSYPVMHLNLFFLAWQGLRPHVSVIDGWEGMEGDGPTDGTPVPWRIAVASRDPVAADALTADAMGYPLEEIGYLYYAHLARLGQGDVTRMNVVGNVGPEEVKRPFRPHRLIQNQRQWKDARVLALVSAIMSGKADVQSPNGNER